MNGPNIPEPDLDLLLKQTLKDDLPPEAEVRMNRHFLNLKRSLENHEDLAERDNGWIWVHGVFRKEILAFAAAVMLILGAVMHLGGYQSALAHSISRLQTERSRLLKVRFQWTQQIFPKTP